MTQNTTARIRRPWWVIGAGTVTSVILTLVFALMLARTALVTAPWSGWDVAFVAVLAPLVVSGIASIVYFTRRS